MHDPLQALLLRSLRKRNGKRSAKLSWIQTVKNLVHRSCREGRPGRNQPFVREKKRIPKNKFQNSQGSDCRQSTHQKHSRQTKEKTKLRWQPLLWNRQEQIIQRYHRSHHRHSRIRCTFPLQSVHRPRPQSWKVVRCRSLRQNCKNCASSLRLKRYALT